MKTRFLALSMILLSALAINAQAVPIEYVQIGGVADQTGITSYVPSTFDGSALTISSPTLSISVIYRDGTSLVHHNAWFQAVMPLVSSSTSGGMAIGTFGSGTFVLRDEEDNPLFFGSTSATTFIIIPTGIPFTTITGGGEFAAEGGRLVAEMPVDFGGFSLFAYVPNKVSDFNASWTGTSTVSYHPVPEPATIALLSLGLGGIMLNLRNRRRK